MEGCRSDGNQAWLSVWWLGMPGETGRQVMGLTHGSGDFLAYGSPSISAHAHEEAKQKREG